MSKRIRLRNVPDSLHRKLKARSALLVTSLPEYFVHEIQRIAERPTPEELRRRLQRRSRVIPSPSPAEALREERGGR